MGGQLSYKACGIDMWGEGGEGQLAGVHIGRGYECKANFNPNIDVTNASGHTKRKEEFEDMSPISDPASTPPALLALSPNPLAITLATTLALALALALALSCRPLGPNLAGELELDGHGALLVDAQRPLQPADGAALLRDAGAIEKQLQQQ
eukprot:2135790-Prymnesium_polylepis.1